MTVRVFHGARLVGGVETISEEVITGWASEDGEPARLQISIDESWSAEIQADLPRPDLVRAGYPGGRGFTVAVPARFLDLRPHRLRIQGLRSGEVLHDEPDTRLLTKASLIYRTWRREVALRNGIWHCNATRWEGAQLSGSGWFIPPRAKEVPFQFKVNGQTAELVRAQHQLPALTAPLGLVGIYDQPQFVFRVTLPAPRPELLQFSWCDASGRPFDPLRDHWRDLAAVPLPPAELRRRVQGDDNAAGFNMIGGNVAHAVRAAVARHHPGGLGACAAMLDWGCGCGRVARYLIRHVGGRFTGCDPDPEAIAWCRAYLPGASFEVSGFRPPLPFGDASFDCIYGGSVFTHLGEADQFRWLAELARVLRPGGLLVATVLGNTAWSRIRRPAEEFLAWQRSGFADFGPSPDLDGAFAEAAEYRNVSHSADYIARHWTRDFALLELTDGGIGCWQDTVVLRRQG